MKPKNFLISSGPTKVFLDPVRYISNISSGKMGLAWVNACLERNYNVRVVSGKVDFEYPIHQNLQIFNAEKNHEMFNVLKQNFEWADVFVSVAAVVDFEPLKFSEQKIKKSNNFCLELKNSVDILETLANSKKQNQILIGYALETENLLENAKQKLKKKNLDFIIANKMEESMGLDEAAAKLISKDGKIVDFAKTKKYDLVKKIFEALVF